MKVLHAQAYPTLVYLSLSEITKTTHTDDAAGALPGTTTTRTTDTPTTATTATATTSAAAEEKQ